MSLANKLAGVPFVGNLIKTSYLISTGALARKMDCYTVRLSEPICDSDALVISEKELFNAHTRYVSAVDQLKANSPSPSEYKPGKFYEVTVKSSNRNKRVFTNLLINLFSSPYSGSDFTQPTGFLFSGSEVKDMAARAIKLSKTVKRPSIWQKIKLYLCKWFKGFPKEV